MKWDSVALLKRDFDGITLKDFKNEISNLGRELGVIDNVANYFTLLPRIVNVITPVYKEVPQSMKRRYSLKDVNFPFYFFSGNRFTDQHSLL